MPRAAKNGAAPFAGARFLATRGDREDGKLITLANVTNQERLWELASEAVTAGVALTISRTKDGTSVCVAFFADGERSSWYLASEQDWMELIQTVSV